MSTENIQKFLATAYSDEKLAALLAHAQDGKLSFLSCCCLVGSATASHPLRSIEGTICDLDTSDLSAHQIFRHLAKARVLPFAEKAEEEFDRLAFEGPTTVIPFDADKAKIADAKRRERLIPLILAEMERREQKREIPKHVEPVTQESGK